MKLEIGELKCNREKITRTNKCIFAFKIQYEVKTVENSLSYYVGPLIL